MPTNPEKTKKILTALEKQVEAIQVQHANAVEGQLLMSMCIFLLLALGSHQEKVRHEFIDNDYLLIVVAICFLFTAFLETYKIEKSEEVDEIIKDMENTTQLQKDLRALRRE